jgi:hypothetical protein
LEDGEVTVSAGDLRWAFRSEEHVCRLLIDIARCHPLPWDGAKPVSSTGYVVEDYPFEALAEPSGSVRLLAFDLDMLGADRTRDPKPVVTEVAADSIRHGGGRGHPGTDVDGTSGGEQPPAGIAACRQRTCRSPGRRQPTCCGVMCRADR